MIVSMRAATGSSATSRGDRQRWSETIGRLAASLIGAPGLVLLLGLALSPKPIRNGRVAIVLRGSLAGLALGIAAMTAAGELGQAAANEAQSPTGVSEPTIAFDIPALPIEDALYAFSAASGIEVFVDGSAVGGLRSSPVKGMLTVQRALDVLLTGTGLNAYPVGDRAISLSVGPRPGRGAAEFRDYSAMLQRTSLRRLCAIPELRLGSFRIAIKFWIDQSGAVENATLLSSTGDRARDGRILSALRAMPLTRPPAALPQPVIMVILPRALTETGDCADDAHGR